MNKLKALRLKIGKWILDKSSRVNNPQSLEHPKSLLFLRQDGKIGDYIVSSFVFREIKKFNPLIKIGVICTKQNAYLFQRNHNIDEIYLVKKRNILDYIKTALFIRKERYDVVIDPTLVLRNRDLLLLRILNARNYIGYRKADYNIFNINITKDGHFSEIYKEALAQSNISLSDDRYDIPQDDLIKEEILQFITDNKLNNFITINFYGNGKNRKFDDSHIVDYLTYIRDSNKHQLILLATPDTYEHLSRIANQFNDVFVYPNPHTTIYHTIELIRNCALLISVDTSTVHIASGLNKPMICFYSQDKENFTHWHPNSKNVCHIIHYYDNVNEISPREIKPEWLDI